MKRVISVLLAVLLLLCGMIPLSCTASSYNPNMIFLSFDHAPEGTAYIDLLAQIRDTDDVYAAFEAAPKRLLDYHHGRDDVFEPLPIDENSEIARYCDDGFVSLSIHSTLITDLVITTGCRDAVDRWLETYDGYLKTTCHAEQLYRSYQDLKLAYVSETGEILQVTDCVKAIYTSDPPHAHAEPWSFAADGSTAQFRMPSLSPVGMMGIIGALFANYVLLPLSAVLLVSRLIGCILVLLRQRAKQQKANTYSHDV